VLRARRELLNRLVGNAKRIGEYAVLSVNFETVGVPDGTAMIFSAYDACVHHNFSQLIHLDL